MFSLVCEKGRKKETTSTTCLVCGADEYKDVVSDATTCTGCPTDTTTNGVTTATALSGCGNVLFSIL